MNYHKNNRISIQNEPDLVIDHPWNISYIYFTDKDHNSLERCTECGLKFDIHRLIRISAGVFLCPFCNKGAA